MSCSRLSELCSLLYSRQTPSLEPSECCDILLRKYDITECALLQLSALRCLYSDLCPPFHLTSEQGTDRELYSSVFSSEPTPLQNDQNGSSLDFREFSLRLMRAVSQRLPDLFQLLTGSLQSTDQYICFCASKALVHVLLYTGVKAEVITDILSKLQAHVCTHVGLYCLQTVRELLKSMRKRLHTDELPVSTRGQLLLSTHVCLHALCGHRHWLNILELLHSEASRSSASNRQKLELTVGEFLSLTVEIFRHTREQFLSHDSSPVPERGELSLCIVDHLSTLLSLVELCGSVFAVKRFVDISLKAEETSTPVQLLHSIVPVLRVLLRLPLCREVLHYWLEVCGLELLPVSVIRSLAHSAQTKNPSGLGSHRVSSEQSGLVSISVRKMTLLCIRCMASLLHNHSKLPTITGTPTDLLLSLSLMKDLLGDLHELVTCLGLSSEGGGGPESEGGGGSVQLYSGILYQVVSEEDGCLVHTLQASSCAWKNTIGNSIPESIPGLRAFIAIANPHSLWLNFLRSVSFDHSVLLDLLLSPETDLLPVLHHYLQLLIADWEHFEESCWGSCGAVLSGSECSSPQDCLMNGSPSVDSAGVLPPSSRDCGPAECFDSAQLEEDNTRSLSPPAPKRVRPEERQLSVTDSHVPSALVGYSSSSSEDDDKETGQTSSYSCLPIKAVPQNPSSANPRDLAFSRHKTPPPDLQTSATQLHTPLYCIYTTSSATHGPNYCEPNDTDANQYYREPTAVTSHSELQSLSSSPDSALPSHSSPDSTLDKIMGCLIRLRMALQRLQGSGLLPPHLPPTSLCAVASAIETAEERYEETGA